MVTLHSLLTSYEPGFRLADFVLRWSSVPVQLTAVSEVAAAPLRRLAGADREVLVLPNGIDPAAWRIRPAPRPPDQVTVVAVMRLAAAASGRCRCCGCCARPGTGCRPRSTCAR